VLRRLADEHGTVTVEHVKAQRNNSTPVGGAKLLDRLRRLEREFTRVDDFGECGPEALMNGAARARAIADRLEQLAA
jgi:hypothetical protein